MNKLAQDLQDLSIRAQVKVADVAQTMRAIESNGGEPHKAQIDIATILVTVFMLVAAAFTFPPFDLQTLIVSVLSLGLTSLMFGATVNYADFSLLSVPEKMRVVFIFALLFILTCIVTSSLAEFSHYYYTQEASQNHLMC